MPVDCSSCMAWESDAIRLRDVRNYLSHLIQPKLTDEDYEARSSVVRQILMRFGVPDEELDNLFSGLNLYLCFSKQTLCVSHD